jgi:curli biogenesis system outer membrane secretion channel CsgG
LFINTRTSATPTTLKLIKNGVSLGNATTQDNPYARAIELPIYPIYLAAFNNRTNSPTYAQYFSNTECAFASIGDGLTDAEVTTFYNAVQTFQTTLGRQV